MEDLKQLLEKVINGEEKSVNLPFTPINDLEKILKEEFKITLGEWDTNGWCINFWWYTENEEYYISGSLYYGNMIFSKNDLE